MAVTNDGDSPLAAAAALALVTEAGAERAVPATKSYTTQLAALAVLGLGLGADDRTERAVLARCRTAIERLAACDRLEAGRTATPWPGAVVSGRGYAASTALELALKIRRPATSPQWAVLRGPAARPDRRRRRGDPALLVAAEAGPMLAGASWPRVHGAVRSAYGIGGGRAGGGVHVRCRDNLPEGSLRWR